MRWYSRRIFKEFAKKPDPKIFGLVFISLAVLLVPFLVSAQGVIQTFFGEATGFCSYWKKIFDFMVSISGIMAMLMIIGAGIYYIISAGEQQKVSKAKSIMAGALIGFILVLLSWTLFTLISPMLTQCKIEVARLELPENPEETVTQGWSGGFWGAGGDPCTGVLEDHLFDSEKKCMVSGSSVGDIFKITGATPEEAEKVCKAKKGTTSNCISIAGIGTECDCLGEAATKKCDGVCMKKKEKEEKAAQAFSEVSGATYEEVKAACDARNSDLDENSCQTIAEENIIKCTCIPKPKITKKYVVTCNSSDPETPNLALGPFESTISSDDAQMQCVNAGGMVQLVQEIPLGEKWCCITLPTAASCIEAAKKVSILDRNDKEGLARGGIISRINVPWCYRDCAQHDPQGLPAASSYNTSNPVAANPNICATLLDLQAAGLKPVASTIVGNHTRCVGCYNDPALNCFKSGTVNLEKKDPIKCRGETPHWNGRGLDLGQETIEQQKYIYDNLRGKYGITQIIGPWRQYNCDDVHGKGCGDVYGAATQANHNDHIHLTFGSYSGPVASSGSCGTNLASLAQQYLGKCFGPNHCVWFVSYVLRQSGCNMSQTGVNGTLKDELKKIGYTCSGGGGSFKEGDVVFKGTHAEVAISSTETISSNGDQEKCSAYKNSVCPKNLVGESPSSLSTKCSSCCAVTDKNECPGGANHNRGKKAGQTDSDKNQCINIRSSHSNVTEICYKPS